MGLTELFCDVDDFCQDFLPTWETRLLEEGQRKRRRPSRLSISEIITLMIHFHQSHYRNFKAYYLEYVCKHLVSDFSHLLSYSRFVELMPGVVVPLTRYLKKTMGTAAVFPMLIPQNCPCVTIKELTETAYLKSWQRLEKVPWGGFIVPNYI